jgi:sigma-B regulation protein RsbU (phosphoserine phosphatase)
MDEQRRIAATLQARLLPARLPTIEDVDLAVRYWPAGKQNLVGGDFYDVFALEQDRWGIVIGDVCGSGPAAAAITALARHTIRTAAWNGAQPREVLWQLNRAIRNSDHDTFCTALYCILETADPIRLTVAAGGHPLPVLHRPGVETEPVGAYGSALGAKADPTFTETQVELAAEDAVVMYTDGITDVRPPHALESDDVTAIVHEAAEHTRTADAIADRLREHIDAVLPFAQRDDDIAVLVLRVSAHTNRPGDAALQPLRRG